MAHMMMGLGFRNLCFVTFATLDVPFGGLPYNKDMNLGPRAYGNTS